MHGRLSHKQKHSKPQSCSETRLAGSLVVDSRNSFYKETCADTDISEYVPRYFICFWFRVELFLVSHSIVVFIGRM